MATVTTGRRETGSYVISSTAASSYPGRLRPPTNRSTSSSRSFKRQRRLQEGTDARNRRLREVSRVWFLRPRTAHRPDEQPQCAPRAGAVAAAQVTNPHIRRRLGWIVSLFVGAAIGDVLLRFG